MNRYLPEEEKIILNKHLPLIDAAYAVAESARETLAAAYKLVFTNRLFKRESTEQGIADAAAYAAAVAARRAAVAAYEAALDAPHIEIKKAKAAQRKAERLAKKNRR